MHLQTGVEKMMQLFRALNDDVLFGRPLTLFRLCVPEVAHTSDYLRRLATEANLHNSGGARVHTSLTVEQESISLMRKYC